MRQSLREIKAGQVGRLSQLILVTWGWMIGVTMALALCLYLVGVVEPNARKHDRTVAARVVTCEINALLDDTRRRTALAIKNAPNIYHPPYTLRDLKGCPKKGGSDARKVP